MFHVAIGKYQIETLQGVKEREKVLFFHEDEDFFNLMRLKKFPKSRVVKVRIGEKISFLNRSSENFTLGIHGSDMSMYERIYNNFRSNKIKG